MKRFTGLIAVLLLALSCVSFAGSGEVVERESFAVKSGASTDNYHQERNNTFALSHTMAIRYSATPTSPNIRVYGCSASDVCNATALATYTSTSNGLLFFYGVYDKYKITTSYTGTLTLYMDLTGSAQPGGASANNGVMAIAGTAIGDSVASYANGIYDGSGSNTLAAVGAYAYNGANWDRQMVCQNSVAINMNTATTAQLVALVSAKRIYVCSLSLMAAGTTNVTITSGTGAACASTPAVITGPYPMTTTSGPVNMAAGYGYLFRTTSAYALCITNSAAVQISGFLSYAQY